MRVEREQALLRKSALHSKPGGAPLWSLAAALLGLSLVADAQDLEVESYKVAGGGGTSSGGAFTLSGTVGQADSGPVSNGGRFALRGGFWSRYIALQTPGAPTLTIIRTGSNVQITWPANGATGYVLQESAALGPAAIWANAPSAVAQSDGINKVMIAVQPGHHFFRLARAQ